MVWTMGMSLFDLVMVIDWPKVGWFSLALHALILSAMFGDIFNAWFVSDFGQKVDRYLDTKTTSDRRTTGHIYPNSI